jgi:hypothetical protein
LIQTSQGYHLLGTDEAPAKKNNEIVIRISIQIHFNIAKYFLRIQFKFIYNMGNFKHCKIGKK